MSPLQIALLFATVWLEIGLALELEVADCFTSEENFPCFSFFLISSISLLRSLRMRSRSFLRRALLPGRLSREYLPSVLLILASSSLSSS